MFETKTDVLVIAAHPDDSMICGGTLGKWTSQGLRCSIVIATDGASGNKRCEPNIDLRSVRTQEERDSAKVLGVSEVMFLEKPDGGLDNSSEFRGEIVRLIRKFRPGLIITHDPTARFLTHVGTARFPCVQEWVHRDHRVLGEVTMDAIRPYASGKSFYPEHFQEGLAPYTVTDVLLWDTEFPSYYEGLDELCMRRKMEAIACHRTQYPKMEPDVTTWFYAQAKQAARAGGVKDFKYAEPFRYINLRPPF